MANITTRSLSRATTIITLNNVTRLISRLRHDVRNNVMTGNMVNTKGVIIGDTKRASRQGTTINRLADTTMEAITTGSRRHVGTRFTTLLYALILAFLNLRFRATNNVRGNATYESSIQRATRIRLGTFTIRRTVMTALGTSRTMALVRTNASCNTRNDIRTEDVAATHRCTGHFSLLFRAEISLRFISSFAR